jgi:hypothetical protein
MCIPADFPREPVISSLAGAQPKLSVRVDVVSGKYANGPTEQDVQERYEVCADLVTQLVAKCHANRDSKYVHLSEAQILERLLTQLLATDWGTAAEMRWVIRRAASDLRWSIPADAIALKVMLGELQ